MVDKQKPRHGSMAYWPRKRAKTQNASVYWPESEEKRILGVAGYKAGMTHISYIDPTESPTKGQEIVSAATVIEIPPVTVYGIRYYDKKNSIGDVLAEDEAVLKKAGVRKKKAKKEIKAEGAADVRLLAYTQPSKTGMGKKRIEKMELGCGGKDVNEKIEFAKSLLGKEVKISDVFKAGEYVDITSVTKGKGWQGPVKRYGISTQRKKATGKVRHVGTLGPFKPPYVQYTAPQAGQVGYHKRTELNKMVLKIGSNPDEINPKSGFENYGFVKNDYLIVRGSIPGPVKRLVKVRTAVRMQGVQTEPQVVFVSAESR